jgi:3,4-dihydroxy 2-butanone 4-phosphate synthase / GTP cyclohydrolase II
VPPSIERALEDLRAGKFVVVADDEDRENEGDLVCAAELVTPEMVNFMLEAKGMICLAMTNEWVDQPRTRPMQVDENTEAMRTAFTVSIDAAAKYGVTTGISASDRATTIRVAADPDAGAPTCACRARLHPLRARDGGVLQRVGHTEAAVDLCRLAGLPAGVICEILNDDGTHGARPQLERFAAEHGLTFITVAQLVAHRLRTSARARVAEARLPTEFGEFRVVGYRNDVDETRARRHGPTATSPTARTCWCACTPSASPATSSTRAAATAAGSSTTAMR